VCFSERDVVDLIDAQQTIDAVPMSAVRKAAKKLAYIHQQIDLYGDRPDLHDEEYWLEYLMDEEWEDPDIECVKQQTIDAEPHWIPCSERLPEEPFGCLVTVLDTDPVTMDEFENILPYFVGWDGEQWNDGDGLQCPFEVIAWMPLPKPYEVEDENAD
jgi:hypothetical protein